jgi:hypothetical protein
MQKVNHRRKNKCQQFNLDFYKMIKQIAIYGGAFDPPHLGHLGLIKHLISLPGMDEVWVLPCGDR